MELFATYDIKLIDFLCTFKLIIAEIRGGLTSK